MPLIINQGPLPQDGDRVAADIFLEDWVRGTTIGGLDANSFRTSINLIASQTDTPTSRRGLLWFKRGEGTLYIREEVDRGESRYTGARNAPNVAIAPQRAVMAEVQDGFAPVGAGVAIGEITTQGFLSSFFEDSEGRRIVIFRSSTGNMPSITKQGFYTGVITDTTGTLQPTQLIQWGFTNALIASGGSNLGRGYFAKVSYDSSASNAGWFHPRSAAWTGETSYGSVGIICETNATTEQHLALIFKRPGLDFGWRMAY